MATFSTVTTQRTGRSIKSAEATMMLHEMPSVGDHELALGQFRWNPEPMPNEETDFLSGIRTTTTAGIAAHVYVAGVSMVSSHFFDSGTLEEGQS
jgi:homogentisate 1,2-dioxygenase